MDSNKIIEVLAYTIPSIITGSVAYYFFKSYLQDKQNTRRWLLQKDAQKQALPLRLQAYERITLYLERISLTNLLIRVAPISNDKNDYENLVIAQIEQEFEHNLTQQIYMSDECWTIVTTAKNATIQMIRKANMSDRVDSADKLREVILNDLFDKQSPSSAALGYIKREVSEMW
ncbi:MULTISPECIES: hypothetical protein [unclassified Flavobacterium]|jgi:hypothetical protein|uniref:DUF7935 family protein n=1 Tax=unclassified Flavobacterium TaxID=196869 RepID=UPI00057D2D1C|nr:MULTISPECIES: hypothetical protein [unclassified Flavobacterium]KIA99433.1 hypothetical protein OA93_04510 [Flavobacterium sp. KMS]KIC01151.1 hypothetical protein OA88_15805 [Flavobacterium sp. JRM]MEA9415635.1 hypothetical protein [Flavobacterium sp. PL02]OUL60802.1 hypothetical protein B8T70_18525 [Flavobacterium sp. AJR]